MIKPNLIKRHGLGLAVIAAATALLTLFTTTPASATLVLVQNYSVQQTSNDPCVIGNSSCSGSVLNYYSPTGMPGSPYYFYSPNYLAGAAVSATPQTIPSSFSLGIDENLATSAGNEVLLYWDTFVCSGSCATNTSGGIGTSTPTPLSGFSLDASNSYAGPTAVNNFHNGNGFSDAILTGFNLTMGHTYYFQVGWGNDTDGMEQFFIIPGSSPPPSVPEPGSFGLFGAALVGLGFLRFVANRRRRV